MRVESPKPLRNGGWLHRLRHSHDWHRGRGYSARVALPETTGPQDFGKLAKRYERAATDAAVARFSRVLGVMPEGLRRLHVGWDGEAWIFPMTDATGVVVGIRRRLRDGRKLSVKGGREGLFIPTDLSEFGKLLVCEGPTDTAALLDLGFDAIGRPSCTGGTRHVVALARGRDVVVVSDADDPGQWGATRLASTLQSYCPTIRIILPPPGIKDARAWVRAGATADDIRGTLKNGTVRRLTSKHEPDGILHYARP
ncbi:MAG: hypothetical protein WBE26_13795 [Phycisphaerae bacterium]